VDRTSARAGCICPGSRNVASAAADMTTLPNDLSGLANSSIRATDRRVVNLDRSVLVALGGGSHKPNPAAGLDSSDFSCSFGQPDLLTAFKQEPHKRQEQHKF
jgi:hypothetical protein